MDGTIAEREAVWDAFLTRWPMEKLAVMRLTEYSRAGDQDCFTYWVEKKTESIGSIWGGSSFKFGVYSRKQKDQKENKAGRCFNAEYGWMQKYGTTPEGAFQAVHALILSVAESARAGDLTSIDSIDLGPAVKWKVAFLYQNRNSPCILPIFTVENLQTALESTGSTVSALQHELMARAEGKPVLEFGDSVWNHVVAKNSTELTPSAAKLFFDSGGRFREVKPPTQHIAGYESNQGQQIALALARKKTTLYLSDGPWLTATESQLQDIVRYSENKPRSSNLSANAPQLALGNPIVKVVVPTKAALIALCDAYQDKDEPDPVDELAMPAPLISPSPPLNQILYGPPGTGKTYGTIDAALEVLAPEYLSAHRRDRQSLKAYFDSLTAAGYIRFVTFHQSFSYEDFVEGLRAENGEDGQLRYVVVDGVFKSLCAAAAAKITRQAAAPSDLTDRNVWKMSLGNTLGGDAYIFGECIDRGYVLMGWGGLTDFSGSKDRAEIVKRFASAGATVTENAYDVTAVHTFLLKMKVGDIIVVSEGNSRFRAIGEITGNYRCVTREEQDDNYGQARSVKWLRVYEPSLPLDDLMKNQFSQMTLYRLRPESIDMEKLAVLLDANKTPGTPALDTAVFRFGQSFGGGYKVISCSPDMVELTKPNGKRLPIGMSLLRSLADYLKEGRLTLDDISAKRVFEKIPETLLEPYLVNGYANILPALVEHVVDRTEQVRGGLQAVRNAKVLIIDEINRGNVSRVLGELITLIEPSKRAGMPEELEVVLPYSKESFSVPANLYVIGTMNTADRSLAGLDIALRRRFQFREVAPRPDLLNGVLVDDVNIGAILRVINERIELLLDRDHCIGHTYFLPLIENPSISTLSSIFRGSILPLLQEYFFEDWQRIQWVLNDHRKAPENRFVSKPIIDMAELFGEGVNVNDQSLRWTINEAAFAIPESYAQIVEVSQLVGA